MPPGGVVMHGMASNDELQRLRDANDVDAEILFLQLMIRHHEGALKMAEEELADGKDQRMRVMARDMYAGQSIEIARMRATLNELH